MCRCPAHTQLAPTQTHFLTWMACWLRMPRSYTMLTSRNVQLSGHHFCNFWINQLLKYSLYESVKTESITILRHHYCNSTNVLLKWSVRSCRLWSLTVCVCVCVFDIHLADINLFVSCLVASLSFAAYRCSPPSWSQQLQRISMQCGGSGNLLS